MKIDAKKPKKGRGKIEVIAQIKEISSLLKEGYPKTAIYEALVKAKQISIGYVAFCRHVNSLTKAATETKQNNSTPTPPLPATGSGHAPTQFAHIKQATAQEVAENLIHGKQED
ncbi:MAG: hypothetical protein JEY79_06075 [Pseudodesulfovibrio sp.]|nr:hypothetical protein [Pseudodesulfovibrio sp.]